MRTAWEKLPSTPQSLTSRPVRGALQVNAREPSSMHTRRLIRSTQTQSSASVITMPLPRMSHRLNGAQDSAPTAKLVWNTAGKARPMPSPSITGKSIRAATNSGWIALPPPISSDITAVNFLPR